VRGFFLMSKRRMVVSAARIEFRLRYFLDRKGAG
jgi:hypothetical protein